MKITTVRTGEVIALSAGPLTVYRITVPHRAIGVLWGDRSIYPPLNGTRAARLLSAARRIAGRIGYALRMTRAMYWPPGPVYIYRASCDCDLTHAYWVEEHPSMFSVYRSMERAWDAAEGHESYSIITEAQFTELAAEGRHVWDEAAERAGY